MIDAIPDYTDLPLGRFFDMVASREPAPGGGASAAVAVALAAALTSMAARFSTDHLTDAETIAARAFIQ
jgi:formiminotetrahydrofolate cyclodeaminase